MKLSVHQVRRWLRPGLRACLGAGLAALAILCGPVSARAASGISFQDIFANRETSSDPSGTVNGSNVGATVEAGEPKHGGKNGGHSVWISWVAPSDGIVTFTTAGSAIDTLLSAYHLQAGDTTVSQLREDARNDDDPLNPPFSLIQIGARAGHQYEIALDGFGGATGNIRLRWDFLATTSPPPVIVSIPNDQSVLESNTVTLTVNLQTSETLDLQWRYNGGSFPEGAALDTHSATLVITNFSATNVGLYSVRITIGTVRFETAPLELQINSEGLTNVLARDKLFDSGNSGVHGGGDDLVGLPKRAAKAALTGVVQGYDGSQVFNTTFATTDPSEPAHCGLTPSASYWFTYRPPTNGTLTIDTSGYNNVVAAYTYTNVVTSYADLISITCDHASVGPTASRIEFAVLKGHDYTVVVAGVAGARGVARLNYHLNSTNPPLAPTLTNAPQLLVVAAGSSVSLQPPLAGSTPLHFIWSKGNNLLPGGTNAAFQLANVTPTNSGDYVVSVWNHIGGPLLVTMPLRVVIPPALNWGAASRSGYLSFATVAGQHYLVEATDALGGNWWPVSESFVADGSVFVLSNSPSLPAQFFRVRVE